MCKVSAMQTAEASPFVQSVLETQEMLDIEQKIREIEQKIKKFEISQPDLVHLLGSTVYASLHQRLAALEQQKTLVKQAMGTFFPKMWFRSLCFRLVRCVNLLRVALFWVAVRSCHHPSESRCG